MAKFILTCALRLQAPNNVNSVVNDIRRQLNNITATVNIAVPPQGQRQLAKAQTSIAKTAKVAKQASGYITGLGEAAAFAGKRFLAFSIAGGAIIKFSSTIKEGVQEAITFERQMNKIAQATGSSASSVAEVSKEISRLGKVFGSSSAELSKASLVLAQAGLSAKDTEKSLQALAKSDLAPTFTSIANTTEGAIALFRQFRINAGDLEKTLGSVNAVAAKFAVESDDIVSAVRRTGGAFSAAGGSINEFIALFTSVRATTRESAESIATGFRTIFTRLQRVRTQDFLKTLGIDLRSIEGQFVGPYEAVRRLSMAMKGLKGTDPRFAQIIEELGGFRQISKVIPLIQQFETSQKALNVAMSGTGSLSEDAARAQETLAVQIAKTKEQFAAMVREMVGSNAFKTMVTVALSLADAFSKIAKTLTPILPLLVGLGALKIGQAIKPFLGGFRAKGGLGFSKGGLVPGTGNRDTVPAQLTPGEYVIRKDAVKALGLNRGGRVPKVQRFAKAGTVKPPSYEFVEGGAGSGQKFGGIFLEGKKGGPAIGQTISGMFDIKYQEGKHRAIQAPFEAHSMSKKFAEDFNARSTKTISALINNRGKKLAGELNLGTGASTKIDSKEIPNYDSMVGGIFEGAVRTLHPYFDAKAKNSTFDFPRGLGGVAEKFGFEDTTLPTDAKNRWNKDSRVSLKKKIVNWYKDQAEPTKAQISATTKKTNAVQQGFGAIPSGTQLTPKMFESLTGISTSGYGPAAVRRKLAHPDIGLIEGIDYRIVSEGKKGTKYYKANSGGLVQRLYPGGYAKTPSYLKSMTGFKPKLTSRSFGVTGEDNANAGRKTQYLTQRLDFLKQKMSAGTISPEEIQELLSLQSKLTEVSKYRSSRFAARFPFAERPNIHTKTLSLQERLANYKQKKIQEFAEGGLARESSPFDKTIPTSKKNPTISMLLYNKKLQEELSKRLQVEQLSFLGAGQFGVAFKDLTSGDVIRLDAGDVERVNLPQMLQATQKEIIETGYKKPVTMERLPFAPSLEDDAKKKKIGRGKIGALEDEFSARIEDVGYIPSDVHSGNIGFKPSTIVPKLLKKSISEATDQVVAIDPGAIIEPPGIRKDYLNKVYAQFAKKIKILAKKKTLPELRKLRRSNTEKIRGANKGILSLSDNAIDTEEGKNQLSQLQKIKGNASTSQNIMIMAIRKKQKLGKFAEGGEVPALLTPGEFVINKQTADRLGDKTLESLNNADKIPRFHKGGRVGYADGGRVGYAAGGGVGGIGGLAGAGFLLAGITTLSSTFQGLNKTVDEVINGFTSIISQAGLLFITFKTVTNSVQKYDQKIGASQEKIATLTPQRDTLLKTISEQRGIATKSIGIESKATGVMSNAEAKIQAAYAEATQTTADYLAGTITQDQFNVGIAKANKKQASGAKAKQRASYIRNKAHDAGTPAIALLNKSKIESKEVTKKILEEKRAINENKMFAKATNIAAGALAGLAAVTMVLGNSFEEYYKKQIEAGTGGEVGFAATKAASGAASGIGVGASLGAAFGPAGIAIGGLAGAAIGAGKALFDVGNEISSIRNMKIFDEKLAETSRVLDGLSNETVKFSRAYAFVNQQAKQTQSLLTDRTTTPENRQDILSQSKAKLDSYNAYLVTASKDMQDFDAFVKKAGPDIFNLVADLSDIPMSEFAKQWKTTIDNNIKAQASQTRVIDLQDEYANRIKNIIGVTQAFETVALNMQKFESTLDVLIGFSSGAANSLKFLDESARLGTPEKFFDKDRFNALLERDIKGSPFLQSTGTGQTQTIGEALSSDLGSAAKTVKDLPNILLRMRDSISSFDAENTIQKLVGEFKGSPKFIQDAIEEAALKIIGTEGKEATLIDAIKKDLIGTAKTLGESFAPIFETAQLVASKQAEEVNRRLAFNDKLNSVIFQELDIRNKGLDIQSQGLELLAKATNKPIDLTKLQGIDTQRQKNILGADAGLAGRPAAIGNRLQEAQNSLMAKTTELERDGIKARSGLQDEIRTEQERIQRLNQALQHLSDIGGRTAVTMQQLERAQAKSSFKYGIAEKTTFAETPGELRDLGLAIRATRKAASEGSIGGVVPGLRGDVLDMLNQIGDVKLDAFGGKLSGKEIKQGIVQDRLQQMGFTAADAEKIAKEQSSETDKLLAKLDDQIKVADASNKTLVDINTKTQSDLGKLNQDSINAFADRIAGILNKQKEEQIVGKIDRTKGQYETAVQNEQAFKDLSKEFGGDDRLTAISKSLEDIKTYSKAQQDKGKYSNFINTIGQSQKQMSEAHATRSSLGRTSFFGDVGADLGAAKGIIATSDQFEAALKKQKDYILATTGDISAVQDFEQNVRKNPKLQRGPNDSVNAVEAAGVISDAIIALRKKLLDQINTSSEAELRLRSAGLMGTGTSSDLTEAEITKISSGMKDLDIKLRMVAGLDGGLGQLNKQASDLADVLKDQRAQLRSAEFNPPKPVAGSQRGGLVRFAKGGIVPGTGNQDSVLSLLTPGETVIPKMASGGRVSVFDRLEEERRKSSEEFYRRKRREEEYRRSSPGTIPVDGVKPLGVDGAKPELTGRAKRRDDYLQGKKDRRAQYEAGRKRSIITNAPTTAPTTADILKYGKPAGGGATVIDYETSEGLRGVLKTSNAERARRIASGGRKGAELKDTRIRPNRLSDENRAANADRAKRIAKSGAESITELETTKQLEGILGISLLPTKESMQATQDARIQQSLDNIKKRNEKAKNFKRMDVDVEKMFGVATPRTKEEMQIAYDKAKSEREKRIREKYGLQIGGIVRMQKGGLTKEEELNALLKAGATGSQGMGMAHTFGPSKTTEDLVANQPRFGNIAGIAMSSYGDDSPEDLAKRIVGYNAEAAPREKQRAEQLDYSIKRRQLQEVHPVAGKLLPEYGAAGQAFRNLKPKSDSEKKFNALSDVKGANDRYWQRNLDQQAQYKLLAQQKRAEYQKDDDRSLLEKSWDRTIGGALTVVGSLAGSALSTVDESEEFYREKQKQGGVGGYLAGLGAGYLGGVGHTAKGVGDVGAGVINAGEYVGVKVASKTAELVGGAANLVGAKNVGKGYSDFAEKTNKLAGSLASDFGGNIARLSGNVAGLVGDTIIDPLVSADLGMTERISGIKYGQSELHQNILGFGHENQPYFGTEGAALHQITGGEKGTISEGFTEAQKISAGKIKQAADLTTGLIMTPAFKAVGSVGNKIAGTVAKGAKSVGNAITPNIVKSLGGKAGKFLAEVPDYLGVSAKPVYQRTPFSQGQVSRTVTEKGFGAKAPGEGLPENIASKYKPKVSRGARAEGERLRAQQDKLIASAAKPRNKIPAQMVREPVVGPSIKESVAGPSNIDIQNSGLGQSRSGRLFRGKNYGKPTEKPQVKLRPKEIDDLLQQAEIEVQKATISDSGKLYGATEKVGLTNDPVAATGKSAIKTPKSSIKGRKAVEARRLATMSEEAGKVFEMGNKEAPMTFTNAKEMKAYVRKWGRDMGFDENILPLGKGEITFDKREFARGLTDLNKGRAKPVKVPGLVRGNKAIFDPLQEASATIGRHESMHVIQNKLGPKWSDPKVQAKLDKIVEPLRKKMIDAGITGDVLTTNELTARIMSHNSLAPQLVKRIRRAVGFQSGSLVPGAGSGDKVPALLEPGEFVFNRNAVRAIGAEKLSKTNKRFSRFQTGGMVGAQAGGAVAGMDFSQMDKAVQNFGTYVDKLTAFSDSIKGLEIQLRGTHTVEVLFNGLQIMSGLQDSIKNLVVTETNKAINKMLDIKFSLPPMDK